MFVTSLGHNTEMIANPMYLDMVARALLWTTGHLKDDGTPAAGYGVRQVNPNLQLPTPKGSLSNTACETPGYKLVGGLNHVLFARCALGVGSWRVDRDLHCAAGIGAVDRDPAGSLTGAMTGIVRQRMMNASTWNEPARVNTIP